MTILVTGATGLLGNNVVRLLLERGRSVACLVRDGSDPRPLDGLPVRIVVGDVRDATSVEAAVEGAELVVHAAARTGTGLRNTAAFRDVNVGGTLTVSQACRRRGVRLVHVSTVEALRPGTREEPSDESAASGPTLPIPYRITKREAELVVLGEVDRGLDAVIVNPGYLLGPWDWKPSSGRLLLTVARGRGLLAPPGGADFCHVSDVAEGLMSAARSGARGERYILSGEALSYREAFDLFARVTGAPDPVWTVPRPLLDFAGRVGDIVGRVSGEEPHLNSGTVLGASTAHHFSSDKARGELGYRPRPAEDAVRDAWRWFRRHGYA